jgi:hypothetical protein
MSCLHLSLTHTFSFYWLLPTLLFILSSFQSIIIEELFYKVYMSHDHSSTAVSVKSQGIHGITMRKGRKEGDGAGGNV